MKRFQECMKYSAITLGLLIGATMLGGYFRSWHLHETNIVIAYLLSVLLTARITRGYFYGIAATVLSFLLFNFFFTEPYYSLKINDPTYIMTIVIMTITAIITSALTTKVKQAAEEAQEKEAESNALYRMTNRLTDAENTEHIASIIVSTVSRVLFCHAAFVVYDKSGRPSGSFLQQRDYDRQIHRELENPVEFQKRIEALHTSYDAGPEFYDYPVYGRNKVLAVVRIPSECAQNLTDTQIRLLHALLENTSLALDRLYSLEAQAKSREEAIQERYRGNLLRAISHDLRTPLSGIMGTSEMLMDMTDKEDPRYDMSRDIYEDAAWLHSLVENILNLTRFQDGRIQLHKEQEAAEEVIGAALTVMEKRMPERSIEVHAPEELLLVPMDARLITQVLVNLLNNAGQHTPVGNQILVSLREEDGNAVFSVADRGSGIPEDALPKLFQMFFTTTRNETSGKRGIGLGLSICQSIVEAHGGTITARNREGGGAEFIFTLPMGGKNA